MKTSSAKAKGRKLQQEVVKMILEKFPELTERDVESTPMGCAGTDIKLSETAFKKFPFSVECKNQEKLSIWKCLKQAETENREGKPLLVFSKNRTPIYVALKIEDFFNLLKG